MAKQYLDEANWSPRSGHVPTLDGVRAWSVGLVLLGHVVLPSALVGVSALGLKTFFFISGFLITRLLLAEHQERGSVSLGNFYARRGLRLLPVLVVYVAVVCAVQVVRQVAISGVDIASVFLYFVNYRVIYLDLHGLPLTIPVGMFWSLSVEEHFYLFAPLAVVLMRGNARKTLMLALGICAFSLGLRFLYCEIWPGIEDSLRLYQSSETRFDSIAYGVALAAMSGTAAGRQLIRLFSTKWSFIAGLALLIGSYVIRDNYFEATIRFSIQGVALMLILTPIIFSAALPSVNRSLNSALLSWIGKLSYSIYVWHGAMVFFFHGWFQYFGWPVTIALELALNLAFAVASYYLIEMPILRLRKRFSGRTPAFRQPAEVAE